MNLVSRCSETNPNVLASTASESLVETRYESQQPLSSWTEQHLRTGDLLMNKQEVRSPHHTIQKRKQSHGVINVLDNVDFISSNVKSSRQEALLYVFEDNEAAIKMIIKGRSPMMRHVSRTHRVA